MFSVRFVRTNKVACAIALFIVGMCALHVLKPAAIYTAEGGFRPFGVGYRHKTVVPAWAASIVLAVFAYLAVMYIVTYG